MNGEETLMYVSLTSLAQALMVLATGMRRLVLRP